MTWPQATDYNAAVQNPQVCFGDDDLRQGQVVGDLFGLPRPHSGNFADVYQIQGSDNQSWAIKCFTRPVAGLHQRYQAISDHLQQAQRAFMVEFHYLEEGIRIHGQWYPLVKMRWVEGFTLNDFIRQHLDKPALLERLAQMWIRLGEELRDAAMAHGDLQHGNVLLAPSGKSGSLALKLIDYDGMFVPALADTPSGEVGHPNYQHPQRLREGAYHREIDRFSHLLIYTALRCVRAGGAELWQRYDTLENLLFREDDFRQPAKSRLLRDLWSLKESDARNLVGHLLLASQGPLLVVPSLDELVDENAVRPLSDHEETQVNALLAEAAATPRKSRLVLPAQIVPATPRARVIEIEPTSDVLVAGADTTTILETLPEGDSLKVTTPGLSRLSTPPPLPRYRRPPNAENANLPIGGAFDPAAMMDPIVAILSRPRWLAALGAIALVSFLVVNLLVWSSIKRPPPAVPDIQQPRPQPQPLQDATLKGEHKRQLPPVIERPSKKTAPKARLKMRKAVNTLSVKAGAKADLQVLLERGDAKGLAEVCLDGLPAGATALPAIVPPDHSLATVTIETAADMETGQSAVKIKAWVGGQKADEREFTFNVEKPAAAVPVDKPARPHAEQPERVAFTTVDRVKLVGTLYPGSKGKNGACVLMLPEVSPPSRAEPAAWQRLAETIQAEGHTVLTFDFRGQGASKSVTADFWKFSVNRALPVYGKTRWEDGVPVTIDADEFPGEYMPWMIHDIAAARMFLDWRHEDPRSCVNSANLMLFGVGRGAALGSLWLASEGIRYDAQQAGKAVKLVGLENQDILRGVWLGIETKWKGHTFPVSQWVAWRHRLHPDKEVPIDFLYGAEDVRAYRLARELIGDGNGNSHPIPAARRSGINLLAKDCPSEKSIREYLVKLLNAYQLRQWKPRQLSAHCSYWGFPTPAHTIDFYLAKRPGERMVRPVPLRGFEIHMEGLPFPRPVVPGKSD